MSEIPSIIPVDIPDGEKGNWKVYTFSVSKEDETAQMFRSLFGGRGRYVPAGTYKGLSLRGQIIMSNTPDEIRDHRAFFKEARGRVLINGLGLGIALNVVLHKLDVNGKPAVTEAIVVEKSPDVIDLVQGSFKDKRIKFVLYDALEYKAEGTFDAVWHDIWPIINVSNLKEMQKLHRKYGRKTNWQGSWCRRECERHL